MGVAVHEMLLFRLAPIVLGALIVAGCIPEFESIECLRNSDCSDTQMCVRSRCVATGRMDASVDAGDGPREDAAGAREAGVDAGVSDATIGPDVRVGADRRDVVDTGPASDGGRPDAGPRPGRFELFEPMDGAEVHPSVGELSWSASSGADEYRIEVDTTQDFSSGVVTSWTGRARRTTSMATVQPATTYFWRVIAVNAAGETVAANAPFSFHVAAPPEVPVPNTPADARTVECPIQFSWFPAQRATSYVIEVETSQPLPMNPAYTRGIWMQTTGLIDCAEIELSFSDGPGGMNVWGTRLYWAVTAQGLGGEVRGAERSFILPPSPFTLLQPGSGSTVAPPVRLTWSDSRGAMRYIVDVNDDPSMTFPHVRTATIPAGTNELDLSSLDPGTTYYWRVIAVAPTNDARTIGTGSPLAFTAQ